MAAKRYLSADEAAQALDVSLTTLYAYVSRGMIRSESGGAGKRERRYNREDIERLLARKTMRKQPAKAVEEALHWGPPILESALSLITDGGLYYRGMDATHLATEHSVEEVAELLWRGDFPDTLDPQWTDQLHLSDATTAILHLVADLEGIHRFQTILPVMAARDQAAYDLRPIPTRIAGIRILRTLAMIAADRNASDMGIGAMLQRAWSPRTAKARDLYSAALILCADHELNISAFTARCVASAGSPLHAAVIAGISAMQGHKHGGYTRRTEALLQEIGRPAQASKIISDRLSRGEPIPGFGHKLYPDGDPRGRTLLDLITQIRPKSPVISFANDVTAAVADLLGEHPTIDFGLVILARALDLPSERALTLFTLGRTIGWIGHAREEYAANRLIRPRATYIGPLPHDRKSEPDAE